MKSQAKMIEPRKLPVVGTQKRLNPLASFSRFCSSRFIYRHPFGGGYSTSVTLPRNVIKLPLSG